MTQKAFRKIRNLILIAFIIRLFLAMYVPVSGDALWHVNVARYMAENFKIPLFEALGREIFWSTPLFHILMAAGYKLFFTFGGDAAGIIGAKLISPIFSVFTLIFSYLIIKKLYTHKVAYWGTFFIAFLPVHIYLSSIPYIDITFMAFFLIAFYYGLSQRYILAGIFTGISMFTKFNGNLLIIIISCIIFINKKEILSNLSKYYISLIPIGSIWYIRNWIHLNNPIWPFLNGIFHGYSLVEPHASTTSILNLFSFTWLGTFIGEIIGIPSGNWNNLSFIQIPFGKILISIWLIGCCLYFVPLLFGIKGYSKYKYLFTIWIFPFIVFSALYLFNINLLFFRFWFGALPIIAILWSLGLKNISHAIPKKLILLFLICISSGFIAVEFAKAKVANNYWDVYERDFNEAQKLIYHNEVILTDGDTQVIAYHTNRYTYNMHTINDIKFDYFWQSSDYTTKVNASIVLEEYNMELVYENPKSGTKIFKVIK